jgi:hypothetical protein
MATEQNNNNNFVSICMCVVGKMEDSEFCLKSYKPYRYLFCLTVVDDHVVSRSLLSPLNYFLLLPITGACVHNLVIEVSQSQYVSANILYTDIKK